MPSPTAKVQNADWVLDHAATGDRWRLFMTDDHPNGPGQILLVYVDGTWAVEDPKREQYQPVARGIEADFHTAVDRAVAVAKAVGWEGMEP